MTEEIKAASYCVGLSIADSLKQQDLDGISPEISKRIFMPNFTTRSTGSGLGLAMVKSIVTQMNGKVAFRTQVDKGSSFFVILPLNQKA